ncbi:MAG: glycosyltransferase family 2 protein [Nitrososphaeraceae archaeon]
MSIEITNFVIQLLWYPAILSSGIYSVFVIIGIVGFHYKAESAPTRANNVEFVIISQASRKVKNSLLDCISNTRIQFPWVPLSLVIDEGSELTDDLLRLVNVTQQQITTTNLKDSTIVHQKESIIARQIHTSKELKIIIVPDRYRKDLVGKGRAINYFIDGYVIDENKWYSFIDDDNIILDDKFLYEIPYYEERGYVAFNPNITPRTGNSRFIRIMDFIRKYDDVTVFRFFTGLLGIPYIGMHGEMLTVKGSVLQEIKYDFYSITEDFRFTAELIKRKMKVWQSKTNICIKSANNINDILRQRGRWFKGISLDLKYCPPFMRMIVTSRMVLWIIAIFGTWALSPLWLSWGIHWQSELFIVSGVYPWIIFIYAIIKNKEPLYCILFIPLFGILESISYWFGINNKGFYVIDKN